MLRKIFFIFLLGIISLLFFYPLLNSQNIIYSGDLTGSDFTELNVPFRYLLQKSLHNHELPLWTDSLSAGFTQLAEGQTGVFYPLNTILYYFFSLPAALNLSVILNFFLSCVFMYFFARSIGLKKAGAFYSAIAFSFSGFFLFRIKHLNLINAAIWLPLELFLIGKFFHKKTGYGKMAMLVFLGVVLSIQFFAGHPQISYISMVGCLMYFLYCYSRNLEVEKKLNLLKKIVLPGLLIIIIFLGLSAIQFLPSLELFKIASRSSWINFDNAVLYKFHPANLLYFIFPFLFGNPADATYAQSIRDFGVFWESNIYFGALSFVFALFSILRGFKNNSRVRFFCLILAVSIIFIFAGYINFYKILWYIMPGLAWFRFPQRFLLLAIFSLAILSGFGFERFMEKVKEKIKGCAFLTKAGSLPALISVFVIILLIVDLFIVHSSYNNYVNYDSYYSPPPSAKFLSQDKDLYRICSVDWMQAWQKIYFLSGGWNNNLSLYLENKSLIPPNLNAIWGISSIDDRGIFEGGVGGIEQFSEINELLRTNFVSQKLNDNLEIPASILKLYGLQNVKYFLSYMDLKNDAGLKLANRENSAHLPPLNIYENKFVQPRAIPYFRVKTIKEPKDQLLELFSKDFESDKVLILDQDVAYSDRQNIENAEVKIGKFAGREIIINVDFPQDGFLFVSNAYYPGWKAVIDQKSAPILRGQYAFQAIFVPQGKHNINFYYDPIFYKIGKFISFFTLLLIIVFFFACFKFGFCGKKLRA